MYNYNVVSIILSKFKIFYKITCQHSATILVMAKVVHLGELFIYYYFNYLFHLAWD